jgi:6-phosphogluconolactonase (cycloisomerase 2 family)
MRRPFLTLLMAVVVGALTWNCGSLVQTLSISPAQLTTNAGAAAQTLTAIDTIRGFVNRSGPIGATWKLSNCSISGSGNPCGTVNPTTTTIPGESYTPPLSLPSQATVTLNATVSLHSGELTATAAITILPPISVSVSPPKANVPAGTGTQSFSATVSNDAAKAGVTWTLSSGGSVSACTAVGNPCGTVSASSASGAQITYAAPATVPASPTVTLTATSVTDSTKTNSAVITIVPPAAIIVSVSPNAAAVQAGIGTQPFSATVSNSTNTGVTWTLTAAGASCSPTCGTLSQVTKTSVLYTAPASLPSAPNNTPTLTATAAADGKTTGTATVTITPPITITLTPRSVSVPAGSANQQFTATVTNTANTGVNWSLSGAGCSGAGSPCGSVPATGTSGTPISYTAPATPPSPNMVTLTATAAANGKTSVTATITVTPASVMAVPRFLFAATGTTAGSSTVAQFTVSSTTGQLRPNGFARLNDGPLASGPIAIDPSYKYLYALTSANFSIMPGNLHAFSIGTNGNLTPIGTPYSVGIAPTQVIMDPKGRYVYVANQISSINGFTVNTDGSLTAMAATFATSNPAKFMVIEPTGNYLYMLNINNSAVEAFSIGSGGALTAITTGSVNAGTQPVWMSIDPAGTFAYVVNQGDNTVSPFTIVQTNGTTCGGTPVNAGALCPNGSPVTGGTGSIAAAMAPSGNYLYTADQGSSTVTAFSMNAGALTKLATYLTLVTPQSLFLDPSGTYLYFGVTPTVGGTLEDIGAFQVIPATGLLTITNSLPVRTNGTPIGMAGTAGNSPVTYTPTLAFISNTSSPSLASSFSVDATTGNLTFQSTANEGPDAQNFAADPWGRYLFVSDLNASSATSSVTAFSIASTNGALTAIIGSPFAGGTMPQGIAVDPTGQFVYVANGTSPTGTVSALVIEPNAACSSIPLSSQVAGALCPLGTSVTAGNFPDAVVIDGTGSFLYVSNVNSNSVQVFSIGPSGSLTSIATTTVPGTPSLVALAIDPFSRFLYAVEESTNTIEIFIINSDGTLTSSGSASGTVNLLNLAIDPLGRFLFVTNNVANNIVAYTINANTGALFPLPNPYSFPGSKSSYGLTVDISGQYLYVTDSTNNAVVQFTINQTTGALTPVGTAVPTNGQIPNPVVTIGTIR